MVSNDLPEAVFVWFPINEDVVFPNNGLEKMELAILNALYKSDDVCSWSLLSSSL